MIQLLNRYTFFSAVVLLLFLLFSSSVYGQTVTPTPTSTSGLSPTPTTSGSSKELSDLQGKINELQSKLDELQKEGKTLKSQIAVMDNQIALTELRMDATQAEITDITLDIDITTNKIETLEQSLNALSEILISNVVTTYEVSLSGASPLQTLASSDSISDFFTRATYLKIVQDHHKRLIVETQQAKTDYANQRQIFEDKKKKVESLKAQLESYTQQLAQEKKEKTALLEATKSNESLYQQRLQAALAEQRAIRQITSGLGNAVSAGKVKEGDVIGYMISGRSPCSSGTHLHFEVYKGGSLQDPTGYLSNKSVTFENSPDSSFSFSGSWNWPLADTVYIEQGFGMTYWARSGWYAGGPHTGIDMFSNSMAVRAVKEGELFKGAIACGGGSLPFARVDQEESIQAYYLHITN